MTVIDLRRVLPCCVPLSVVVSGLLKLDITLYMRAGGAADYHQ
jgi:hypothetical protein